MRGVLTIGFVLAIGCGTQPRDRVEKVESVPVSQAAMALPTVLTRVSTQAPLLNPRDIDSPITGRRGIFAIGDPCAFYHDEEELWRVFWSANDVYAEEMGLNEIGMMGAVSSNGIEFTTLSFLPMTQVGNFDTGSMETCDVIKVGTGADRLYYMFYSASALTPDEVTGEEFTTWRVGLAISQDGFRFEALPASLSSAGTEGLLFDSTDILGKSMRKGNFVTDPVVSFARGKFHMWTLCVQQLPDARGGVCYHTSYDAINWHHHGVVKGLDRAFPIQPTVFFNPATKNFEMYVVMDTPQEEQAV
ncbi:MAG: hypothetical protein AAFQ82_26790, partial [Myxococcota bacterium]